MKWIVTRDAEGKSGLVELDVSEIIKFTTDNTRIVIHTKDDIFYFPFDTIEKIQHALESMDMPFVRADRGNLINLDKVIEIDENYAKAYFEGAQPGSRGKEATISKPTNYKRIVTMFKARRERGSE